MSIKVGPYIYPNTAKDRAAAKAEALGKKPSAPAPEPKPKKAKKS